MRTVLVMLGPLLLSAPVLAQALPDTAPAVRVPFTLLPSRHMMLEVKVNGKGPFNLIFDTGAPLNLVNNKLAKEVGVSKKSGGGGLFGGGLFGGGMNQVEFKTLQVGKVNVEKLPAVVMDHPTVKAISNAFESEYGAIDGIIGFPFFGRYATTVDYQKKELVLKPTDYKPGDYMADLTNSLMKAGEKSSDARVVGAAGLWGFSVDKPAKDQESAGVIVTTIFADSPATAAGLKVQDRILTIDGRWTDSVGDAYLASSLVKPGRTVDVVVRRGDKEMTLKMTPKKGY